MKISPKCQTWVKVDMEYRKTLPFFLMFFYFESMK